MKTTTFLLGLFLAAAAPAYAQSATTTTFSLLAPSLDPHQELARQQAIRDLQARRLAAAIQAPRKNFFGKGKHRHHIPSSNQPTGLPISVDNQSSPVRRRD